MKKKASSHNTGRNGSPSLLQNVKSIILLFPKAINDTMWNIGNLHKTKFSLEKILSCSRRKKSIFGKAYSA